MHWFLTSEPHTSRPARRCWRLHFPCAAASLQVIRYAYPETSATLTDYDNADPLQFWRVRGGGRARGRGRGWGWGP